MKNLLACTALLFAALVPFSTPVGAAPTGMTCPGAIGRSSSGTCTFNVQFAGETVIATISNTALTFQQGRDNREIAIGTSGNTGSVRVWGTGRTGNVTVCVLDVLRRVKSCAIVQVI